MKAFDLEALRKTFADNRVHIALAKVEKVVEASQKSALMVQVSVMPERRSIVARMTWEAVGPEAGIFFYPQVGDLVLVVMVDGDEEQAFVIKRLTSKEDKIPVNAADGSLVMKALAMKKAWLTASTIFLSKADGAPTENLVLGKVLQSLLEDMLQLIADICAEIAIHTHAGNLGYPTSPPNEAVNFQQFAGDADELKSSPVGDDEILSDFAFTEKGS